MWAWYFLYISCTYHTYSTGHSTCNISWCAEIVTFSVYFLYLSYIQYRSFDLDFLMCRNCHIFCTFPVPIIHTVQVIRPGAFPDLQKLSHFLYISCTYHTYMQSGHSTWSISWCAQFVACSVQFLYESYTKSVQVTRNSFWWVETVTCTMYLNFLYQPGPVHMQCMPHACTHTKLTLML